MTTDTNPLLITTGLPAYDSIRPQHVEPAVRELLTSCRSLLNEIEHAEPGNWDALMVPFEKIDLFFEYGWSPVGHLLGVANSDELRAAHETVLPEIIEFGLATRQSPPVYARFCALRDSPEWSHMPSARRRIVEQSILSAQQAGIALEGEQRERFNMIAQRLSQLRTDFANHVLDATKAWHLDVTSPEDAAGLPLSFRRMAAAAWSQATQNSDAPPATAESGPWRIKLDAPSFVPFMEHCRNRALREKVYRAYITRASTGDLDNSGLIQEILQLRREQAQLLGYPDYAALSLSRKMAAAVPAVQAMFDQLLSVSQSAGKRELQEVTEFAERNGHVGPLCHWDVAFWSERLREDRYAFTDEELRPYFSLDRVLDGLFGVCHRLFGIRMERADDEAPVWHPDVRFYRVFSEAGERIAGFYLDPFSRPENKRGGAWMADCVARSVSSLGTRLPVAHLICNGTPPVGDTPSLMTFREVETLFHEFGHGLQHMLTTVNERDASGITGVEWDAVELPSQFMENWCYHRPTLMGMAMHYETGEPLPEELFEKICRARTYGAATQMLRQLQFGMTDMELHAAFDPNGSESAFHVHARIAQQTSPLPPLPENRFLCSFQHIFSGGYAAGYYSYKWAEVLSADAFSAFEEAGLDNDAAVAEVGRRFRDTILAEGGSRHPMDIYRDFRGREPDPAALLRHHGLTDV
ncbi:MAG: M3 family metallopeptidase [Planctomycetaceae bacterium]